MPKKKKNTRKTVAFVLALIALAFLIINSITFLVSRDQVITALTQSKDLTGVMPSISTFITIFVIAWLILFVIMSYVVYLLEKDRAKWYVLLILSIISLLTARVDTCVLGIISSILYYKKEK